jgi:hypothetical protein
MMVNVNSPSPLSEERRRFVLGEFEYYRILAHRVGDLRRQLAAGSDVADLLVRETDKILESAMTREQLASAIAAVLMMAAQGDLDNEWTQATAIEASLAAGLPLEFRARRGGIRWPTQPSH